jgi:hypothetical protein
MALLALTLGSACTAQTAAPESPGAVLAALRTPVQGPVVVEFHDGEIELTISEDRTGNRMSHQINEFHGDVEMRFVDGLVYTAADAASSFRGRWASFTLEEFATRDVKLAPNTALQTLLEEASLTVFGYTIEECLAMEPVPERQGTQWLVPCAPDVGFVVAFDARGRITTRSWKGIYTATYRYESLEIVAPSDVLDADEMRAYSREARVAATKLSITAKLDAIRRSGEARYVTGAGADTRLVDELVRESGAMVAGDVTREDATALRLTVTGDGASGCSALLRFEYGKGTISDVTCRD